jgi:hypothetical protein
VDEENVFPVISELSQRKRLPYIHFMIDDVVHFRDITDL